MQGIATAQGVLNLVRQMYELHYQVKAELVGNPALYEREYGSKRERPFLPPCDFSQVIQTTVYLSD